MWVDGNIVWKGAWVGSGDGHPSDAALDASANAFMLTSPMKRQTLDPPCKRGQPLMSQDLECTGGTFRGDYLLDHGDGLRPFADFKHSFAISKVS